jgi:hypothetical protein
MFLLTLTVALAAPPTTTEICHWNGAAWQRLAVHPNAVPAHFADHGDRYARDEELCDDGVDDDCDGEIDEGCATECPCFTADDIDAAYARWLTYTDRNPDADFSESVASCVDYSFTDEATGERVDQTYVSFYDSEQDLFDDPTDPDVDWTSSSEQFYAYADTAEGFAYCQAFTYDIGFDFPTDTYLWEVLFDNGQLVAPDEREACAELVLAWAADHALTCSNG